MFLEFHSFTFYLRFLLLRRDAYLASGVGFILLSTLRFVRTTRRLDDTEEHSASSVCGELVLAAMLVLFVASYSIYLALD